jgi:hypothetical protein
MFFIRIDLACSKSVVSLKGQDFLLLQLQSAAKKDLGNPNKDLGTSSVVRKEQRRTAYAILRIWL